MLDLTTTELADELVGGILSAGPGQSRNASNLFENTISVADQIQQLSATDQSATGFLVILNRAGV